MTVSFNNLRIQFFFVLNTLRETLTKYVFEVFCIKELNLPHILVFMKLS